MSDGIYYYEKQDTRSPLGYKKADIILIINILFKMFSFFYIDS